MREMLQAWNIERFKDEVLFGLQIGLLLLNWMSEGELEITQVYM